MDNGLFSHLQFCSTQAVVYDIGLTMERSYSWVFIQLWWSVVNSVITQWSCDHTRFEHLNYINSITCSWFNQGFPNKRKPGFDLMIFILIFISHGFKLWKNLRRKVNWNFTYILVDLFLACYFTFLFFTTLMATLKSDERFCEKRNTAYISKWVRKSIRQYDNFDQSLEGLQSFFKDVKVLCVCLGFWFTSPFLLQVWCLNKCFSIFIQTGAGWQECRCIALYWC